MDKLPEAKTPEKGTEYDNLPGVAQCVIKRPNLKIVEFGITGTAPLVTYRLGPDWNGLAGKVAWGKSVTGKVGNGRPG